MSDLVATFDVPAHRWPSLASLLEQHAHLLGMRRELVRATFDHDIVHLVIGVAGGGTGALEEFRATIDGLTHDEPDVVLRSCVRPPH
jgi:hypothetical protein